jgi:tetratricopeptide (TPR) repeat protein
MKNEHRTAVINYVKTASIRSSLESDPQVLFFKAKKGHTYELTARTDASIGILSVNPRHISVPRYSRSHYSSRVSGNLWGMIKDVDTSQYVHKNDPSELEIDSTDDYLWRGAAYIWDRRWAESIADCDKVIEENLKNGHESDESLLKIAYNNRGWANYKLFQYDKAIDDFTKAIEIDPAYALAIYNRGKVYYDNREYGKALADIEKAQSLKWNVSKDVLAKMREAVNRAKNVN